MFHDLIYCTEHKIRRNRLFRSLRPFLLVSALCRKIWWKYLFLSCHSTLQSSHLCISVYCSTSFPWTVVVTGMFGSNPCVSTVINNTICINYIFKWEEDRENIWDIQRALWCLFFFCCFRFFSPLCAILKMSTWYNSFLVNGNAAMV